VQGPGRLHLPDSPDKGGLRALSGAISIPQGYASVRPAHPAAPQLFEHAIARDSLAGHGYGKLIIHTSASVELKPK
jgi:hypothetical protein